MAEGLLEVGASEGTGVEGEADGRDEVGLVPVPERRGALVLGGDGEAEDGAVGVEEGAARGGLELQKLNFGYFVVHINKPAQLVGLVCVGRDVLCSSGAFMRLRQAKWAHKYS